MSHLNETMEEYAIDTGSGILIPERDLAIREQIFEYAITKADSAFHRAISHLYEYWDTINAEHFDGVLIPPVILLAEPGATTCYGDCSTVSGFGGSSQIRIRPSILDGTLQALANGSKDPAGLMRFAEHVLLHETVHQWTHECLPREAVIAESKNYNGHGPIFSSKANEIGEKLGYPTVRKHNKSRGERWSPTISLSVATQCLSL